METRSPAEFAKLGRPAQRALANAGITDLNGLTELTQKQFLALHGVGKSSLKVLLPMLQDAGLSFKA